MKRISLLIASSFLLGCHGGDVDGDILKTSKTSENYSNTSKSVIWDVGDIEDKYDELFCDGELNTDKCRHNIASIKNDINSGGFDLSKKPIEDNSSHVEAVKLVTIDYQSNVMLPNDKKLSQLFKTSGLMMFPRGSDFESSDIKGVILYFHPTAFDKQNVPSSMAAYTKQDYVYAGLFAAQGYVVMLPDYIGQGIDYRNIHPYVLYPVPNVSSAMQLLNIGARYIESEYAIDRNYDKLKLFTVGYSEGGAYSIWFSKCGQGFCNYLDNNVPDSNKIYYHFNRLYDYVASVGLDGAYDLSNVVKPFLTEDVEKDSVNRFNIENVEVTNLVKPGLSMLALMSYMKYNLKYDSSEQFAKAYNSEFYNMKCTGSLNPQSGCNLSIGSVQKNLNFLQALTEEHINDTEFVQSIFKSAIYKKLEQGGVTYRYLYNIFDVFSPSKNSIDALSYKSMLDSNDFSTAMKNASITNFGSETKKPLMLFSLEHDSVVSPNSTINFVNSDLVTKVYLKNDKVHVRNLLNDKDVAVDHIHGENYANIYALNFINQCVKDNGKCGLSQ